MTVKRILSQSPEGSAGDFHPVRFKLWDANDKCLNPPKGPPAISTLRLTVIAFCPQL